MKNVTDDLQADKRGSFSNQKWLRVAVTAGHTFTHSPCVLTCNPSLCLDLFPGLNWGDPRMWTCHTRSSPHWHNPCSLLNGAGAPQEPPPGPWVCRTYQVNLVFKPFVNMPFRWPHLCKSIAVRPTLTWVTLSFWYLKIIPVTPIKTSSV